MGGFKTLAFAWQIIRRALIPREGFILNIVIIGAGACGLVAARRFTRDGARVTVLEKSRGVGGRLATRRTDRARFDHGAQYYSLKPELSSLHERWLAAGLVTEWFTAEGVPKIRAPDGMTSLAKNLAEGLDVRLNIRARRLRPIAGGWRIEVDDGGADLEADVVFVTAPVPQALDLLKDSEITYDPALADVRYATALVGLFEDVRSPKGLSGPVGFAENIHPDVATIADQHIKGLSTIPAWTVTMTDGFSRERYDQSDETTLREIVDVLTGLDGGFTFGTATLKKWRYAHPLNSVGSDFARIAPGLYLAGDGFGRPSVIGAVVSGEAIARTVSIR